MPEPANEPANDTDRSEPTGPADPTAPARQSNRTGEPSPAAKLLRFQQPEKTLRYLGELSDDRLAGLFGLDGDTYRARLRAYDDQVRETAAGLLEDPSFAERVGRLPFRPGQLVVALGESTTADRLSWCEVLRHLLPEDVRLVNLAVSGLTTTQALAQLPQLSRFRPDWILCMIGANDTQRLGRSPGAPGTRLVSAAETERNLHALRALAAPDAADRWVWLTPSGVDQARADSYPHFLRAGIGWAAEDTDGIADFLLGRPEPTVDTRPVTAGLHIDDGVHLTPEGQRAIAVALVDTLTDHTPPGVTTDHTPPDAATDHTSSGVTTERTPPDAATGRTALVAPVEPVPSRAVAS
ncbi:SGNH/GDSL hydrolase family protein [Streptomyces sp. NPDC101490]|uniref:SGNH/GDSL hydrolase family protein n=1 Tax=Streptomyces sp. NPDC101490 TaxID=3366143 RepID=UPI0037FF3DB0